MGRSGDRVSIQGGLEEHRHRSVRSVPRSEPRLLASLVRAARPKQWTKNLLLFAAPGAAGVLLEPGPLARVLVGFGVWCAAASGIYLVNDALDAERDRHHPIKVTRPVAAGAVPEGLAASFGAILLTSAVASGWLLLSTTFALVVALYVAIMLAYSVRLKHVVILDLVVVAAGFVLRAIGGGVAAEVEISSWFLIVASFGSLFMVTGKRHAEATNVGTAAATRVVLSYYSAGYLHFVRSTAAAVTILAYCLWAFDEAVASSAGAIWYELSIIPFVLATLRYALLLEAGFGEAPEELVARDRPLQFAGLVWTGVYALGVYAG
ncbi:MAG TPA: decaprenyl-phosphate phosphoribosyltransferase [Nitriliruptorales bacterium]|nr:decaprenyl-phosphate phosphoribosyltransferase [Nitriliruptorales bacterium]